MYDSDTQAKLRDILKAIMTDFQPQPLSQVISQYQEAKAQALSVHTLRDYGLTFTRLLAVIPGDRLFSEITIKDLRDFLHTIPGGRKTVKNAHIALGSLWTFAIGEGVCVDHTPRRVEIAKPEQRAIIPFTKEEAARILAATGGGRHKLRDLAIVKTLLDTGVRASELCGLKLSDLEGDYLRVMGKGSKERRVPVSGSVMASLVEYIGSSPARRRSSPIFLSEGGKQINRDTLRQLIERLGEKGKVTNAHPHKFRHTFAINYLLNGGDPYTLQAILGHSTMEMVKRYLHLTSRDLAAVHSRASPLKNWGL